MSCRTRLQEPIASVTFVEPNPMPVAETIEVKITLSEHSTSTTSDVTDVAKPADGEPTATMPYLLTTSGCRILKRQTSSVRSVPFAVLSQIKFRSLTKVLCNTLLLWFHLVPSSAASESLKNNTFRIYPSEESEVDRLVTKALVLGDFGSAVSLCLSAERYADAVLLAVKGGPELLNNTQKAYF